MPFSFNEDKPVFSIGIQSNKNLEQLLDEGKTFKEANEAMQIKFMPVDEIEFVEGPNESGKRLVKELIDEYKAYKLEEGKKKK